MYENTRVSKDKKIILIKVQEIKENNKRKQKKPFERKKR
jgi:hypothetical protein